MLTLRPELSNLDACDVRETPLTWRSTTGALAYLSLYNSEKGQGQVTAATGACGICLCHAVIADLWRQILYQCGAVTVEHPARCYPYFHHLKYF